MAAQADIQRSLKSPPQPASVSHPRSGYEWIVDADIAAFFDTVDHVKLIAALNEEIADGSVLNLITHILQAGVIEPHVGEMEPTSLGTPQGGPLSPLLANVYRHHFDVRVKQAGYGSVRYADDFVIFARSEAQANAALQLVYEVLEGELGLQVHPEKTRVVNIDTGFDFLGFRYYRDANSNQLRKVVRRKSMLRFREAVRQRTPRLRNQRKPKASRFKPDRLADNAPNGDWPQAQQQWPGVRSIILVERERSTHHLSPEQGAVWSEAKRERHYYN